MEAIGSTDQGAREVCDTNDNNMVSPHDQFNMSFGNLNGSCIGMFTMKQNPTSGSHFNMVVVGGEDGEYAFIPVKASLASCQ